MNKAISNGRMAAQLDDVRTCLADLARRGCRVKAINIGLLPRPRVTIERPPRRASIQGFGYLIKPTQGGRLTRYAASHKHCQVEWEEIA